jgi:hypothetical protein
LNGRGDTSSEADIGIRDPASILTGRHIVLGTTTTREQELAGSFVAGLQVLIDGLAGLLAQFKSDRPTSFLLSNRCAIRRVAAGGDILGQDGDDVTAAKLAVDRQIEHREVANSAFDLELRPEKAYDGAGLPRDTDLVRHHGRRHTPLPRQR